MESSIRKKFVFPGDKANKLNPFFLPFKENYVNYHPPSFFETASHTVAQAGLECMAMLPSQSPRVRMH